MARLLGIDVGTSSVKVVLIDDGGSVLDSASRELSLSSPRPGWAEQDPEDWWAATQDCLSRVKGPYDAIGLTGQMHGSVFLDSAGCVIRPALLWCDQRTVAECSDIEAAVGRDILVEVTGNPMLTGFQLPKVVWLRKNEEAAYAQVSHVLLPKDYVSYRLTGVLSTDVSDASGVGLLDVRARRWSDEVAERVGVPLSWFPDVHESASVVGRTREGVPVVAGAGDQAAGGLGVGAVSPDVVSVSLGTSGVVYRQAPDVQPDPTGSIHSFADATRSWHRMGVMLSCGGAVKWARDTLFGGGGYSEFDTAVQSSKVGANGVTFLPYLAGERCPFVAPTARGEFVGLHLGATRADMARAVLEGVTLGVGSCLDSLVTGQGRPATVRVTGGGAKSPVWLQMLADTLGCVCQTLESDEGPAFGAALLAGIGSGVWPDASTAVRETVKTCREVAPGVTSYSEPLRRFHRLTELLKDRLLSGDTIQ